MKFLRAILLTLLLCFTARADGPVNYLTPFNVGVLSTNFTLLQMQSALGIVAGGTTTLIAGSGITIVTNSPGNYTLSSSGSSASSGPFTNLSVFASNLIALTITGGFTATNTSTHNFALFTNSTFSVINAAGLGVTTADGYMLSNSVAASVGAQQYSPAMHWTGQGWKTAVTAASQPVDFRSYLVPVQGSANPSGLLTFDSAINGGAYGNAMSFSSAGLITATAFSGDGSEMTGLAAGNIATGTITPARWGTGASGTTFARGDNTFSTPIRSATYSGFGTAAGTPLASTTYFLGQSGSALINQKTEGNFDFTVLETGTIIGYSVSVAGTGGGAELVTYTIDYDSGTNIGSTTTAWQSFPVRTAVGSLSQAITSGHHLGLKIVTPAWVSTPTAVTIGFTVLYTVP